MKKIVFVTGANKGIGLGIAKHLGKSGWQVVIGARDEQRAEKAISELKQAGVDVLGWVSWSTMPASQAIWVSTASTRRPYRQRHRAL